LIVEKNNGVDISDLTRFYSKEEWRKLDADVKKKILESPACKKLRAEKDQRGISAVGTDGGPKDSASVVTGSIDKESEERIVSAVIRGVIESSRTNQEEGRNVGEITSHTPSHGSRVGTVIGSVAGTARSRTSSVTFGPSVSHRG
jgi:hypothetical protein